MPMRFLERYWWLSIGAIWFHLSLFLRVGFVLMPIGIRFTQGKIGSEEAYRLFATKLLALAAENGINPIESVLSDLDSLRGTLGDLLALWLDLNIENRKRFQLLSLPRGYVFGRVGTAQRGRRFSLIGTPLPANATLVHLGGRV